MSELNIMNVKGLDCYEKDGVAWLRLEQAARGLGFTDSKNGAEYVRWARVDGYLRELNVFATSGERPDFIPESVFYRLAMKAKNPAAEKFQAWVADEIIPSIRRNGMYAVENLLNNPDLAIQAFTRLKEEQERRRKLEEQARRDAPKVLFAEAVSASGDSILVRDLAKLLRQNGVDVGERRLYNWLRENGYMIRAHGRDKNMPTQRSMEMGLFQIRETTIQHSDGRPDIRKTPLVTGKGQQYFINKFLAKQAAE